MSATDTKVITVGLSQVEAERRLAAHGPNSLPEPAPISICHRLIAQFKSALIYILLFALALDLGLWLHSGADHLPYESIAIALILALNAGLGAWHESKADAALSRLKALAAPSVWVLRDGALVQLPASALALGSVTVIATDKTGTLTERSSA